MIRLRILWNETFKPNNRHPAGLSLFGFGDQNRHKMIGKDISRSIRPYNKEEWQKIAWGFLADKKAPSSALDASYIALRCDDPALAEKCHEEALRRRKSIKILE